MVPSLLTIGAVANEGGVRNVLRAATPGWFSFLQTPRCRSLGKLVSQLPLLVPRWQAGSLHKPIP
jgi:hypothetical protein